MAKKNERTHKERPTLNILLTCPEQCHPKAKHHKNHHKTKILILVSLALAS